MVSRKAIIAEAEAELALETAALPGPQGPFSKDFSEAGEPVRGGYARLQDYFRRAAGMSAGTLQDPSFRSTTLKPLDKEWCGIFGASVMKKAGVKIGWNLVKGKAYGDDIAELFQWRSDVVFDPALRTAENMYLEPGDLVMIKAHEHHFLVMEIYSDRKTIRTIEGNATDEQLIVGRKRSVSELVNIFKVTGDSKFPSAVFGSVRPLPAGIPQGTWKVDVNGKLYYYTFANPRRVTWGSAPGSLEGEGHWFATGGGWLKIAWLSSGSLELWNVTGKPRLVLGRYYHKADAPVIISAVKT